jgi:putrescine transport system substrate-binding protein
MLLSNLRCSALNRATTHRIGNIRSIWLWRHLVKPLPVAASKIKRALSALGLTCALAVAATPNASSAQGVLNIYNWSDYIAEDTIKNFEKETGIKVRYDTFDNNEILHAKLVAGKTGYDIVVPSSNWAAIQIAGGLMLKLDKSKIPNYKNLDASIMGSLSKLDPGNQHIIPWLWGFTTVGINVDKVKAALGNMPMPANPYDLVFDEKYISKLKSCGVSFLDSASEIVPVVLHYQGKYAYSRNAADYREALPLLQKIRPHVTLFSSSGYINDMAGGSICVALGWSGDINIARQRAIDGKTGQNIQALIPPGGAVPFFDTMGVPNDAPNVENAYKFINYILRPEVHASLSNKVFYANPNKESLKFVKKEVAENPTVFLKEADAKKLVPVDSVPNDIRRSITRIFTSFKTGL